MMTTMAEDLAPEGESPAIDVEPITHERFAPFGRLIACPGTGDPRAVNEGSAERWDSQSPCSNQRAHATLNVATFQARPRPMPFELHTLERHPFSTQIFVPLRAGRYVVVVAEGQERVPGALHAFTVPGDMGIAYAPGVWHHSLIVLETPASFACFVWEDGSPNDCEVVSLGSSERRRLQL